MHSSDLISTTVSASTWLWDLGHPNFSEHALLSDEIGRIQDGMAVDQSIHYYFWALARGRLLLGVVRDVGAFGTAITILHLMSRCLDVSSSLPPESGFILKHTLQMPLVMVSYGAGCLPPEWTLRLSCKLLFSDSGSPGWPVHGSSLNELGIE